jgi:hypothetical protein
MYGNAKTRFRGCACSSATWHVEFREYAICGQLLPDVHCVSEAAERQKFTIHEYNFWGRMLVLIYAFRYGSRMTRNSYISDVREDARLY